MDYWICSKYDGIAIDRNCKNRIKVNGVKEEKETRYSRMSAHRVKGAK